MSVIAYRDGIVSSDSRLVSGSTIVTDTADKLLDLGRGDVLAGVGTYADINAVYHWLVVDYTWRKKFGQSVLLDKERPRIQDHSIFWIFHVSDGTMWEMDDSLMPYKLPLSAGGFAALGSGQDAALGAMAAGASSAEAVRIACQLHTDCGGTIVSMPTVAR